MHQWPMFSMAIAVSLMGRPLGVEATGRQLLATTNTSGIYYNSSKDYMSLGCIPHGPWTSMSPVHEYFQFEYDDTRMSATRCASMVRALAQKTSNTLVPEDVKGDRFAFATANSEWCMVINIAELPGALSTLPYKPSGACELRCSDPNAADISCGGASTALSLYVFKGKQGYTDLGCYAYNTTSHPGSTDLTGTSAGKMTPAECYRLSAAYDFFGLVKGSRCIGFTSLQAAVAAVQNETIVAQNMKSYDCQVPCRGAANTTCGGNSTMQLYARNKPVPQLAPVSVTPSDHVYLGCVGDQTWSTREDRQTCASNATSWSCAAPGLESLVLRSISYINPTDCASAAKRAGKRVFGLQPSFSEEIPGTSCRAGSSLVSALRYSAKPGACDTLCAPDNICRGGGPGSTSLYVLKSGKDYTNLGCYALRPDGAPLPQLLLDSPKMTPGFCYKRAVAYKFFALFNGTRCYAGNDLAPSLRFSRGSTGCAAPCGNLKQTCGGPVSFMVYVNHAPQAAPPPVPLSVGPAGDAAAPVAAPSTTPRDIQRQRLLEGKDAMDPTWSSPCMRDWYNTTYPCKGDTPQWKGISVCRNGMVTNITLSECRLTGTLPTTWGPLPGMESLTFLRLDDNQLDGSLPASWGKLLGLKTLDVSINMLRGTLPASWGGLDKLAYLNLAFNGFRGALPGSWGGMTALEVLYLLETAGYNGTIPCGWANMGTKSKGIVWDENITGNLTYLGLAKTNLRGCYPSSGLEVAGSMYGSSPVSGVRGTPSCTAEPNGGVACPAT